MKKNIINLLLKILLLLLILYFIIDFSNKYEGLKNFGEEIIEYKAPIGYKKVMNIIKHPEKATKSYSIDTSDTTLIDNISGDPSYNVNLFNNNNNYSNRKIMRDLKFFNNSTNLMLYHKDNSTNDILYNNYPQPNTPLYESFVSVKRKKEDIDCDCSASTSSCQDWEDGTCGTECDIQILTQLSEFCPTYLERLYNSQEIDPQNYQHSIGLDNSINFTNCFTNTTSRADSCNEYDNKKLFDNYPYDYTEFNKKYDDVNKDLNFFYNASSILKNHYLNDQLPK